MAEEDSPHGKQEEGLLEGARTPSEGEGSRGVGVHLEPYEPPMFTSEPVQPRKEVAPWESPPARLQREAGGGFRRFSLEDSSSSTLKSAALDTLSTYLHDTRDEFVEPASPLRACAMLELGIQGLPIAMRRARLAVAIHRRPIRRLWKRLSGAAAPYNPASSSLLLQHPTQPGHSVFAAVCEAGRFNRRGWEHCVGWDTVGAWAHVATTNITSPQLLTALGDSELGSLAFEVAPILEMCPWDVFLALSHTAASAQTSSSEQKQHDYTLEEDWELCFTLIETPPGKSTIAPFVKPPVHSAPPWSASAPLPPEPILVSPPDAATPQAQTPDQGRGQTGEDLSIHLPPQVGGRGLYTTSALEGYEYTPEPYSWIPVTSTASFRRRASRSRSMSSGNMSSGNSNKSIAGDSDDDDDDFYDDEEEEDEFQFNTVMDRLLGGGGAVRGRKKPNVKLSRSNSHNRVDSSESPEVPLKTLASSPTEHDTARGQGRKPSRKRVGIALMKWCLPQSVLMTAARWHWPQDAHQAEPDAPHESPTASPPLRPDLVFPRRSSSHTGSAQSSPPLPPTPEAHELPVAQSLPSGLSLTGMDPSTSFSRRRSLSKEVPSFHVPVNVGLSLVDLPRCLKMPSTPKANRVLLQASQTASGAVSPVPLLGEEKPNRDQPCASPEAFPSTTSSWVAAIKHAIQGSAFGAGFYPVTDSASPLVAATQPGRTAEEHKVQLLIKIRRVMPLRRGR